MGVSISVSFICSVVLGYGDVNDIYVYGHMASSTFTVGR